MIIAMRKAWLLMNNLGIHLTQRQLLILQELLMRLGLTS